MTNIAFNYQLALENFQLSVNSSFPMQGVTALFGHSGCGKSTLLRCIAGLEKPPQAYLKVNDCVWDDSANNIHLATYRRQVAYVFQEASLFPHLSVLNNLQFGAKRSNNINAATQLAQAIDLLDIESLLPRKPERLSGGERQRVAIARALAVCPELLLMDEPLASLDMPRKREILPFIQRVHKEMKIPVLYVTHSPAEVRRLANHMLIMESGKIITEGKLSEIDSRLFDDTMLL